MIVGWRAATSMTTDLVLDPLEMAIWNRARAGVTDLTGLVHHNPRAGPRSSTTLHETVSARPGETPRVSRNTGAVQSPRSLQSPDGTWQPITSDGIQMFNIASVTVSRYRYRGNRIPNPSAANHASMAATVKSPVR